MTRNEAGESGTQDVAPALAGPPVHGNGVVAPWRPGFASAKVPSAERQIDEREVGTVRIEVEE
ncbi:MAG TPA: hypothetical protein VN897_16460, partial [Mycobacterium sp.]|nr:hypothetical protein [Mycobacterium sp.]